MFVAHGDSSSTPLRTKARHKFMCRIATLLDTSSELHSYGHVPQCTVHSNDNLSEFVGGIQNYSS